MALSSRAEARKQLAKTKRPEVNLADEDEETLVPKAKGIIFDGSDSDEKNKKLSSDTEKAGKFAPTKTKIKKDTVMVPQEKVNSKTTIVTPPTTAIRKSSSESSDSSPSNSPRQTRGIVYESDSSVEITPKKKTVAPLSPQQGVIYESSESEDSHHHDQAEEDEEEENKTRTVTQKPKAKRVPPKVIPDVKCTIGDNDAKEVVGTGIVSKRSSKFGPVLGTPEGEKALAKLGKRDKLISTRNKPKTGSGRQLSSENGSDSDCEVTKKSFEIDIDSDDDSDVRDNILNEDSAPSNSEGDIEEDEEDEDDEDEWESDNGEGSYASLSQSYRSSPSKVSNRSHEQILQQLKVQQEKLEEQDDFEEDLGSSDADLFDLPALGSKISRFESSSSEKSSKNIDGRKHSQEAGSPKKSNSHTSKSNDVQTSKNGSSHRNDGEKSNLKKSRSQQSGSGGDEDDFRKHRKSSHEDDTSHNSDEEDISGKKKQNEKESDNEEDDQSHTEQDEEEFIDDSKRGLNDHSSEEVEEEEDQEEEEEYQKHSIKKIAHKDVKHDKHNTKSDQKKDNVEKTLSEIKLEAEREKRELARRCQELEAKLAAQELETRYAREAQSRLTADLEAIKSALLAKESKNKSSGRSKHGQEDHSDEDNIINEGDDHSSKRTHSKTQRDRITSSSSIDEFHERKGHRDSESSNRSDKMESHKKRIGSIDSESSFKNEHIDYNRASSQRSPYETSSKHDQMSKSKVVEENLSHEDSNSESEESNDYKTSKDKRTGMKNKDIEEDQDEEDHDFDFEDGETGGGNLIYELSVKLNSPKTQNLLQSAREKAAQAEKEKQEQQEASEREKIAIIEAKKKRAEELEKRTALKLAEDEENEKRRQQLASHMQGSKAAKHSNEFLNEDEKINSSANVQDEGETDKKSKKKKEIKSPSSVILEEQTSPKKSSSSNPSSPVKTDVKSTKKSTSPTPSSPRSSVDEQNKLSSHKKEEEEEVKKSSTKSSHLSVTTSTDLTSETSPKLESPKKSKKTVSKKSDEEEPLSAESKKVKKVLSKKINHDDPMSSVIPVNDVIISEETVKKTKKDSSKSSTKEISETVTDINSAIIEGETPPVATELGTDKKSGSKSKSKSSLKVGKTVVEIKQEDDEEQVVELEHSVPEKKKKSKLESFSSETDVPVQSKPDIVLEEKNNKKLEEQNSKVDEKTTSKSESKKSKSKDSSVPTPASIPTVVDTKKSIKEKTEKKKKQLRTLASFERSKLFKENKTDDGSVYIQDAEWVKDFDGVEMWDEGSLYILPKERWVIVNHKSNVEENTNNRTLPAHMQDGYDSIWLAAKRGDLEAVKSFVEDGEPVDEIDTRDIDPEEDESWIGKIMICASRSTTGHSPLYWACIMGQVEVAEYLIGQGAKDPKGAVFKAASDPAVVELLKNNGFGKVEEEQTDEQRDAAEKRKKRRAEASRTHNTEESSSKPVPAAHDKKTEMKRRNSTFKGVVKAVKKTASKAKKAIIGDKNS